MKSFKLNIYVQMVWMPIIALIATFISLQSGGKSPLSRGDLLASPINFTNELVSSISLANVPFIFGMTAIQVMLLLLLGDE